jgi:putative FmdB family regulatory protein
MPTYEYACDACGHKFEEFQSIKAAPIAVCPKCGKKKVKRLISAGAGFIFKGSGFYITDYRSDSYKAAAKSEAGGSDATKASKPETAKTETAKTETAKTEAQSPKITPKAESKGTPAAAAKK